MKQHILTAAHVDVVHPKLTHFGIRDYFDQIVGLDNHAAVSKVEEGVQLMAKMKFNKKTNKPILKTTTYKNEKYTANDNRQTTDKLLFTYAIITGEHV